MIPEVVHRLVTSYAAHDAFQNIDHSPIPSQESVIQIIRKSRRILFPGYFSHIRTDTNTLNFFMDQEVRELFECLSKQITRAVQHRCNKYDRTCSRCTESSNEAAFQFTQSLSDLRGILAADVRAAMEGDPAAKSFDEIILCYPGVFAITVYRLAHVLYLLNVPLLPRMMTEYAHSVTGIDIHPGAKIGKSFFIDHGTGVVVGETTEIGNRVRLYQGVTLGALSLPKDAGERLRNKKRHPSIQDDVIIYANATILGGETVIGERSIIGGNVWIIESVPPDTKVLLKLPELVYIGNNNVIKGEKDDESKNISSL